MSRSSSSSSSPTPPKGGVRSIISIFENQSVAVNNEPVYLLRRAKSMGSIASKQTITKRVVERDQVENNLELTQIEQQIQHLQKNISNGYKMYSRESHIYYQNQIVFVLTDIGNIETKNNTKIINKKSELTEALKKLNKKLNSLLPSGEDAGAVVITPAAKYDKSGRNYVQSSGEDAAAKKSTAKYDKFGRRSKSIEEKPEVKVNKKVPIVRETKEIVVERERTEEKPDEVDSAAVSVRSLKELFEKNATENEGKTEFGMVKISRKFLTFNSSSDLKYVPFSEKYKSSEVNGDVTLKKENSVDLDSIDGFANSTSSRELMHSFSEERNFTPDSLTNEDSKSSSSGDESESDHTARDYSEDQQ